MDHEEVRERLSDYLEDALSEEERAAVQAHLADCAQCRAECEALRETLSMLSSLGRVQAPDGFAASVRHKMRRRGRRMRRKEVSQGLRQKVPYETIALVMLLIILAIYLMIFIFRSGDLEFLPSPAPAPRPVPSRPMGPRSRPRGNAGHGAKGALSRPGLPTGSAMERKPRSVAGPMGPVRPSSSHR